MDPHALPICLPRKFHLAISCQTTDRLLDPPYILALKLAFSSFLLGHACVLKLATGGKEKQHSLDRLWDELQELLV